MQSLCCVFEQDTLSAFNSATTIYLSYSYNPVATNTNLRALTLVYPCSGLNIDSNDITEYRN